MKRFVRSIFKKIIMSLLYFVVVSLLETQSIQLNAREYTQEELSMRFSILNEI